MSGVENPSAAALSIPRRTINLELAKRLVASHRHQLSATMQAEAVEEIEQSRAVIDQHLPRWRDIATAPKDGSDIVLLAHGMEIEARYCPGEWSDDTPNSPAEYSGAVWCAFDDALQFEIEEGAGPDREDLHGPVTHWRPKMPLPASPLLTERAGGAK